jgi:uncharacterized membrane protein YsdA (DUF1294 family)
MLRELEIIYFLCINFGAFIVYGVDKRKAQLGKWRIPESTLIMVAVLGGSIGAYAGMKIFRHKTKHLKLSLGIPTIIVLQIVLVLWIINTI